MANLPSSKKRMRQEQTRRQHNRAYQKNFRSLTKQVRKLADEQKTDEARQLLSHAYRAIDKAAKSGVLKQKQASRKKARLAQHVQEKSVSRQS